jgi:hypothetical protein
MRLILYSKPGCHLCEGLQEKLEKIENLQLEWEIRDITTQADWFAAYQYEIPVLFLEYKQGTEQVLRERLPRISPRANQQQLEQILYKYILNIEKNTGQ